MSPAPALHVAHGRGLPVPTWRTPIGSKSRESSAPAFLRLTPDECAAIDAGPPPAPVGKSLHVPGRPPAPPRVPIDEAAVCAEYKAGEDMRTIATRHKVGKERVRAVLVERGVTIRSRAARAAMPPTDAVLAAYAAGDGLRIIAARHHCHANKVRTVLERAGVQVRIRNTGRRWTDAEVADILGSYKAGLGTRALANRHKAGRDTVLALLRAHGVKVRTAAPGVFDPATIARQYRDGDTLLTLSKRYKADRGRLRAALVEQGVTMRPEGFRAA